MAAAQNKFYFMTGNEPLQLRNYGMNGHIPVNMCEVLRMLVCAYVHRCRDTRRTGDTDHRACAERMEMSKLWQKVYFGFIGLLLESC
jgi:hypothetical protein